MKRIWSALLAMWLIAGMAVATERTSTRTTPIPPQGVAEALIATPNDLPGGFKAEGRQGDIVMRNHQATFVIAGVRPTSGYSQYGGRLLDAVLNELGHNGDLLGEMFLAVQDARGVISARVLRAEQVEIVSHGGQGKPAIVKVLAVDDRFPIVDQALRIPSQPLGVRATLTYTLEPDSPSLQIECTLQNTTDRPQVYSLVQGWIQGDGMQMFLPPFGSAEHALRVAGGTPLMGLLQGIRGSMPYVANVGSGIAYGLFLNEGEITQMQKAQDIYLIGLLKSAQTPPGETVTARWVFTVSKAETETLRREHARFQKSEVALHTLEGQVRDNAGAPIPNARVYLFHSENGEERFTTVVRTDSRGNFSAELPAGNWRGVVFGNHHTPREFTATVPSTNPVGVFLNAPAQLRIRGLDERRRPAPTTVVFERLGNNPMPKPERVRFGEQGNFGRFDRVHFSLSGDETLQVEPGRYRITLARGFEYEIAQREIELNSGESLTFEAVLAHTANLPGYMGADFHMHTIPSPDSYDFYDDNVIAYIANGMHIMVMTDHDCNTDLSPYVEALRVRDRIATIVGNEVSPMNSFGHFNLFPQRHDPNLPNNGAIRWYDKTPSQIFEAGRKNYEGDVIVQVNHPRAPTMGYFLFYGFDPKTGTAQRPDGFDTSFDAIEIFNGDNPAAAEVILQDWFAFLSQGKRYLATGNTDSHHVHRLQPGYPRTYVYFGHREPWRVTPDNLVATMRQGDMVVCGGPVLTFTAVDPSERRGRAVRMGQTLQLRGDTLRLNVEVRAPSWVRTNTLQVVVNGEAVREIPLNQPENAPLNYKAELDIPLPNGASKGWVVLIAKGDRFTALYTTYPLSFTNPIYWERTQ